jgi:dTDP-glucose pyrophosphorylase/CBS domain-containing protein
MTETKKKWKQAILSPGATIAQAIRNLDIVAIQIVLVVNEDGVLLGTVSDGDIRRGLLKGLTLNSIIDSVTNHKPVVVPNAMDRSLVIQLMTANKIRQVPVVDHGGRVVDLHLWDEVLLPVKRTNLFVIMAGGLGTRLLPHTENCPKPMLPIQGKPMLEHLIERAKGEGFSQFLISIRYLGHVIESYFGDGERFGVDIQYLREDHPLGTAGALSMVSSELRAPFLVTNADVMSDIRYGEVLDFHSRHDAKATMAVRLHEWQHPFGVVHTNGPHIIGFEEKPVAQYQINAGIYVLEPSVLSLLNKDEQCDMPELFERLRLSGARTVAYPMYESWLDVGRPEDLQTVSQKN